MDLFVCTNRGSEQQILGSEFSGVLPLAHYIQLRVICDMQPVYTESQGKKKQHDTHERSVERLNKLQNNMFICYCVALFFPIQSTMLMAFQLQIETCIHTCQRK